MSENKCMKCGKDCSGYSPTCDICHFKADLKVFLVLVGASVVWGILYLCVAI